MNGPDGNIPLRSKLPTVGRSIFSEMSKLALEYKAINLSQGFPDFSCSPELIELVTKYMRLGYNQYAPMPGVLKLRERISEKNKEGYGVISNPDTDITVTCGATEAVFAAVSAVINPGDEVIVFEPAFDSYVAAVKLNGGVCRFVTLTYPNYKIDWELVKAALSKRTKLIIINFPHNPTGSVLSSQDLIELTKVVEGTQILLISDEVYEYMIFDGIKHHSLLSNEVLKNKAFIISSLGKTFHTTGWRIGYCIAPPTLSAEFRKVHQFTTYSVPTPMQFAMAEFLENKDSYSSLSNFFQTKRDHFQSLIKPSRFKIMPCNGTYFQLLNYENISEERDYDLAIRMTREIGVASIPVSVFYHNKKDDKVLRFCFAKENSTLEAAAEKLCRI